MSTPLISSLKTPLCELLGCDVPVVLAGMGGVARSELVAAVTTAGGFGFLGMVREPPELIRSEIARVRAATTRDFGVNLIPAATPSDLLEAELDAVIAERVAAVTLFWDLRPDIVRRLRDIAPRSQLREWFAHEPGRWSEFRDRYLVELRSHATLLDAFRESAADPS